MTSWWVPPNEQHLLVRLSNQTGLQWSLLVAFSKEENRGTWQFDSTNKGILIKIQRCLISPIIHSEELLISSAAQLITVTITKTIGSLVSLGGDTESQHPPIKSSLLKVQHSVTSAGLHFGSQESAPCKSVSRQSSISKYMWTLTCVQQTPAGQPDVSVKLFPMGLLHTPVMELGCVLLVCEPLLYLLLYW